ncbi:MAG: glucans biosynthesis glucosyltransferase MdoH [Pseudomonadota bacterium]|nr:glucans biosynthesis glucosyltransferase MdoH [Pseudomonadota bacterium]
MPPMNRGSMVARPWRGFVGGLLDGWTALAERCAGRAAVPQAASDSMPTPPASADAAATAAWKQAAVRRRRTLLALVALSVVGATAMLDNVLPDYSSDALRSAQIGLFSLLFGWVSAGFYTAMMGFWVQWRGDPHALSSRSVAHDPIAAGARTAVVMPICNEKVSTVFAGLRATCESLIAAGGSRLFDVYVLSDTSDPAIRTAELAAWAQLRDTLGSTTRIHYRWRQRRTQRKSGNVADFCRRWGRNYRYMVVLDADSVMSGDCLLNLVRLMEAHPDAGIIQTAPQASGLSTIHARAQQFAGRVTGRLFSAGMQYWQLGESHYWGHNAILRVEPFMAHCGLAPLPGSGGLSGHIMSHDFVEAALMRRAGYHVWLVHDLAGSYEQQPPNLLEELQRDRRWCQGNLQNARLLAEPGLHGVHRAMLVTGALAYLSAPLWLGYVLLGVALWLFGGHPSFVGDAAVPLEMMALWAGTLVMLVMPRAMGVVTILLRQEQALYGGTAALVRGSLVEGLLSVLQAPLRMVAHTLFVIVALTGLKLDWKSPPREANDIGWADASNRFALVGAVMLAVAGAALVLEPATLLWLAPVGLPLLLAVPLAVLTSRAGLGERVRALGLLVTPEETRTPTVLLEAAKYAHQNARNRSVTLGWREALDNPWLFDVVRSAMGTRNTMWGHRGSARRQLVGRLRAAHDIDSLSTIDRMRLLSEPQHLVRVRDQLMAHADQGHATWGRASAAA